MRHVVATTPFASGTGCCRDVAAEWALRRLTFFKESKQGPEPDATGHHGFYYHFLDMQTGNGCGSARYPHRYFTAARGNLTVGTFSTRRRRSKKKRFARPPIFCTRRVDWHWAPTAGRRSAWLAIETGFIPNQWTGPMNRCSCTFSVSVRRPIRSPESYAAFTSTYQWMNLYGLELLYCGPLFTHQFPHMWIDFRGSELLHARRGSTISRNAAGRR